MENEKKPVELILDGGVILCNLENYGDVAENVIRPLMKTYKNKESKDQLTTSKLRKIYGLIVNLYAQINTQDDFVNHKGDLQYLKVRMAYESGREQTVEEFLKTTKLMDAIGAVGDYEKFKLYCRYAESLVAYFKFYGGKDK